MSLTEREQRKLKKDLLGEEAIPKLWRAARTDARARIWLANHYLATESLKADKVVNTHNNWLNKGWHRRNEQ